MYLCQVLFLPLSHKQAKIGHSDIAEREKNFNKFFIRCWIMSEKSKDHHHREIVKRSEATEIDQDETELEGEAKRGKVSASVPIPRAKLPEELQKATDQQVKYAFTFVMTADPKKALRAAGYNSKWSPTRPLGSKTVKGLVRFIRDSLAESLPAPAPEQVINRLARRLLEDGPTGPSDRGLKDLSSELREWMGHGAQKGANLIIVLPDTYKRFGLPVGGEVGKDVEEATVLSEGPEGDQAE